MSLMRLFMQTVYEMAVAGKWSLMADYFALVTQVLNANEAVVIPGTPIDKPV